VALATELAGRETRRAFVRYADLLEDWRATLGRARDLLALDVAVPPAGTTHELDTWLDAGLRHSQLTWDDIAVPDHLRSLAEEAWLALGALVMDPRSAESMASLDDVRERYAAAYAEAFALARDESRHLQKAAARRSAAKLRTRTKSLRDRLRAQEAFAERVRADRADGARPQGPTGRLRRWLARG
jgi:hypothetical protein